MIRESSTSGENGKTNVDIVFEALTYEAPFLIEKLLKEHIVETDDEARILLSEVKRYLILAYLDETTCWDLYSTRIDEVWHQFVLFTKEYADFSARFFGRFIHHCPSNAPGSPVIGISKSSFDGFRKRYVELFGAPLPDVWCDEQSVTTRRRVINHRAGKLTLRNGKEGMVDLLGVNGDVLLSVNEFARNAMEFISKTGTFYVRELPGDLSDEEKVTLIATMVKYKLLRIGS